ncbi:MAG: hypothetical protein M0Q47_00490 [Methanothrix sp.]|jgi:hypothetical protein|uniref:non-histone chromosomal MC1 family protein n=1 Tax=Methanothrix sp. TaxID=90426 RepID=UPI0025E3C7AB|nr:non-histone chromosomal MC1 family protein [Methanothrix sp.]MCK9404880.1 hypothetical protein [Methanothrix sp.]
MAGEVATLGLNFIADGQIIPGFEAEPDVTAIDQETPGCEAESKTEATGQEMHELKIDPEFRDLIPPLSREEFEALKEDIKVNGCRDKLVVWKDHNILLDGHHRYQICAEQEIRTENMEIELSSRAEAKIWILMNQRGRRNLNESQRAMLAVTLNDIYCEQAKERMGTRTDLGQKLARSEVGRSAEKAAEDMGVSHQTVSFAKKVATKGIPELVRRVESADIAVSAASKIASLPLEKQEKIMEKVETQIEAGSKPKVVALMREIVLSDQETPNESDKLLERFKKNQEASLKLLQNIESSQCPENLAALLAIVEKITAKLKEIEIKSLDLLMHETSSTDKDMKEFALLDGKGNKIKNFKGRSPLQAALKAVAQGHIDIRLREMGTKKVHKFTGEWKQVKMPEDAPSGMLAEIPKPYLKNEGVEILTPIQTLDDTDYELLSFLSYWQPIKYFPLLTKLRKRGWAEQYSTRRITRLIELNLIYMEKYKMKNGTLRAINVRKLTRNPFLSLTQTGKDKVKSHEDTVFERFMSH